MASLAALLSTLFLGAPSAAAAVQAFTVNPTGITWAQGPGPLKFANITGSIQCTAGQTFQITVTTFQGNGRLVGTAPGGVDACTGQLQSWSVTVPATAGVAAHYDASRTQAVAVAGTSDGATAQIAGPVDLRRVPG